MIKCSVYCGASLDGFIAKPDGDIEWLHRPEYATTESTGLTYEKFISTARWYVEALCKVFFQASDVKAHIAYRERAGGLCLRTNCKYKQFII